MNNLVRTYLARFIASLVSGFVVWLAAHYGVQLSDIDQKQLIETIVNLVSIMVTVFGAMYSVTHRTISKDTNPGDAASSHLADREADETARLKTIH